MVNFLSAFSEVDSSTRSRELKAERRSPLVEVAMNPASLSSDWKIKATVGSSSAVFRACLTSSVVNGSSSKICTATRPWCDREKGIFSRCTDHDDQTTFEQSRRKSCLVFIEAMDLVQEQWDQATKKIWPPLRFLVGVFLLSTVALKVRKSILGRSCDRKQYWSFDP